MHYKIYSGYPLHKLGMFLTTCNYTGLVLFWEGRERERGGEIMSRKRNFSFGWSPERPKKPFRKSSSSKHKGTSSDRWWWWWCMKTRVLHDSGKWWTDRQTETLIFTSHSRFSCKTSRGAEGSSASSGHTVKGRDRETRHCLRCSSDFEVLGLKRLYFWEFATFTDFVCRCF